MIDTKVNRRLFLKSAAAAGAAALSDCRSFRPRCRK